MKDFSTTFGPGIYYFGDPCYVLNHEIYHDFWGLKHIYKDGVFPIKNQKFAIGGTAHGDGCYIDSDGKEYGVDAGVLGIIPDSMWKNVDDIDKLGRIIEVKKELKFSVNRGKFEIVVDENEVITVDTKDENWWDEEENY